MKLATDSEVIFDNNSEQKVNHEQAFEKDAFSSVFIVFLQSMNYLKYILATFTILFGLFSNSKPSASMIENTKLLIPSGEGVTTYYDMFGDSVKLNDNQMIVIAADAANNGAAIYFELENDTWVEKQQLLPVGNSSGVRFGESIDWYQDSLVIGAPSNSSSYTNDSVYVFRLKENKWSLEQKITDLSIDTDGFGRAVAIEDNLLFIAAENCSLPFINSNCVVGFERTNNSWQPRFEIQPDRDYSSVFGTSLHLKNSELFVGAKGARNGAIHTVGGVFHYKYSNDKWNLAQSIFASDGLRYDEFSSQIHLEENKLFISSPRHSLPIENTGAIYVFERENKQNSWYQTTKIQPPTNHNSLFFGGSLSFSGNKLLVGHRPPLATKYYSDVSYLYTNDLGVWTETSIFNPVPDGLGLFSHSVGIHKDEIIISEPRSGDGLIDSIHSYSIIDSTVTYNEEIHPQMGNNGAKFGDNISSDNGVLFVSAPGENNDEESIGSVYVYLDEPGDYTLTKKINNPNNVNSESFGLSISAGMGYLAVGSPFDDEMGESSGAVYLFNQEDDWNKSFKILPTTINAQSRFGHSTAIEENTLVVSAPSKDVEGVYAVGEVYIFDLSTNNWLQADTLRPEESMSDDRFGSTVELSKNHLMISSIKGTDISFGVGEVDIYLKIKSKWHYLQRFTDLNENYRNIGAQIKIKNNLAAISAVSQTSSSGVVFILEFDGVSWVYKQTLYPTDFHSGDNFGSSILFLDESIYIGANTHNTFGPHSGAVYQFSYLSNQWNQVQKYSSLSERNGIVFGSSLTTFADNICIGARNEIYRGSGSGSVICQPKDMIFENSFNF